jgi:hypothetical protein
LTLPQIKDGKGGHKLPLRLKLTNPSNDTPSDKRWQRWAKTPSQIKANKARLLTPVSDKRWHRWALKNASAKACKDGYCCPALKLSLEAVNCLVVEG